MAQPPGLALTALPGGAAIGKIQDISAASAYKTSASGAKSIATIQSQAKGIGEGPPPQLPLGQSLRSNRKISLFTNQSRGYCDSKPSGTSGPRCAALPGQR